MLLSPVLLFFPPPPADAEDDDVASLDFCEWRNFERFAAEEGLLPPEWSFTLRFWASWIRKVSSLAGDGMNPMSAPI